MRVVFIYIIWMDGESPHSTQNYTRLKKEVNKKFIARGKKLRAEEGKKKSLFCIKKKIRIKASKKCKEMKEIRSWYKFS